MIEKQKSLISVVFVVNNSENSINSFLNNIISEIDRNFEYYELVCVNNNSKDNTIFQIKEFMRSLENKNATLNIIHVSTFLSHEDALTYGIDLSIGDFIYLFDSLIVDYEVEKVMESYNKLLKDFDIVSVSPSKCITIFQKIYYLVYNLGVEKNKRIFPNRFSIISRRAVNRASALSVISSLNYSVFMNCGLETFRFMFKPSKERVKHGLHDYAKRSNELLENLIIHTRVLPNLIVLLSCFSLIMLLINIFFRYEFSGFWCLLTIIAFFVYIIISYISTVINLNFKSKVQLIKSIEKDVK